MSIEFVREFRGSHFFNIKFLFFLLILFSSCTNITPQTNKSLYQDIQLPQPVFPSSQSIVDLFIMSLCPHAIEAEKVIIPVIKEFQDQIDFHLYFIAEKVDEENTNDLPSVNQERLDPYPEEMSGNCVGEGISEDGRYKSLHSKEEAENVKITQMGEKPKGKPGKSAKN